MTDNNKIERFYFQITTQKKEGHPENYLIKATSAVDALLSAKAYLQEHKEPMGIIAVIPTDITDVITDEQLSAKQAEPVEKVKECVCDDQGLSDSQEKPTETVIVS